MILILQFGSKKTQYIKECINSTGHCAEIVAWDEKFKRPENLTGIVFSGSPVFFTEVRIEPYREKISPLLEWNVPVLGICFGHQLLGLLHGASIFRGEAIRRDETIRLITEDKLFDGLGKEFTMAEDHTEGINLPPGFIHLASSESYAIEGMRHPEKNFWGVQFHPEVSSENGMRLFQNFLSICNK